jgi:hypothetical protein
MPFPLIAAALGAAGSAISAGINQGAYDDAAAAARKAGTLVSGPLSQYAGNALSGLQAPKPAPAL